MKKWFFVVSVFLLSGCSSQFVYNNMDWMVHWYLDDYIDLTKSQKKIFDEQFEVWHAWHRKEELTKYAKQLKGIKEMVQSEQVDLASIQRHFDQVRGHWISLRNRVSPDIAPMAKTLSQEQVASLFDTLEKENSKREEELDESSQQSDEERAKERLSGLEDGVKEWIGKLSADQKAILQSYSPRFNSTARHWLKYRRHVQSLARTLFEQKDSNPNFEQDLIALMSNPENHRHAELVEKNDANNLLYSQMVVELTSTLSAKQKKRLIRKLDDYIDDFEDLSEDD